MTTVEFEGRRYEFPQDATREEIFAFLEARKPAAQQPPLPARVPGAAGVLNWAARNPQDALDTLGTGIGATAGMAVPGGPALQIPMAGLGSAAGKRVARDIGSLFGLSGSEEYPSTTESVVDAGMGAAGPAVGAVAKPAARAISGLSRKGAETLEGLMAGAKSAKATADDVGGMAAAMRAQDAGKRLRPKARAREQAQADEMAEIARGAEELSQQAIKTLRDKTLKTIKETGELPKKGGDLLAIAQVIATGDAVTAAALFGGGRALSKARMKAAERLLSDEKVVAWMARKAEGGITPARLLGSLSGLASVEGVSAALKDDIRTLQAESDGMRDDRDVLERMMQIK